MKLVILLAIFIEMILCPVTFSSLDEEESKVQKYSLINLPVEIQLRILDYCDKISFINMRRTCQQLYRLTKDNSLLSPDDDKLYARLILEDPNTAYHLSSRDDPKLIVARLQRIIKDQFSDHYSVATDTERLSSHLTWQNCLKITYFAKNFDKDNVITAILKRETENKHYRYEHAYELYFDEDPKLPPIIYEFYWNQLAQVDADTREKLIKAYEKEQITLNQT